MASTILGVPETLAAFGRVQLEAEAGKQVASLAGAEAIAADMRTKAPVRTGKLRSSITVTETKEGAEAKATVPYARFVEFGTRYMPAQPFASEAVDDVGQSVVNAMTAIFKRILR